MSAAELLALKVPCLLCLAEPGSPCLGFIRYHRVRFEAARLAKKEGE